MNCTQSCRLLYSLIIALFSLSNLSAQFIPVEIDSEEIEVYHNQYFSLVDPSKELSFEQILSPEFQNQFKLNTTRMNSTSAAYWLKMTFKGKQLENKSWFLESRDPSVNYIDFYIPNEDGTFQRTSMGNLRSFNNKIFNHKNFVLELPNYSEEITLYVRIYSEKTVFFSFRLKSAAFLTSYAINEYVLLGVFYGLMLIMAIYNLLLFIFVKRQIYVWYVLYVVSCMLICLSEDGLGFQFLWPDYPGLNNYIERISGITFLVFFILYSNSYLKLRSKQPQFFKIILSVILLAIISMLFMEDLVYDISYSVIYSTPLILVYIAAFISIKRGNKFARVFVFALSFVVASIIILYLKRIGYFNWEDLTNVEIILLVYAFNIALVFEVIILSIALGRLLHHHQEEQDAAIKASQSRFKGIFESSFDAIFVYDCKNQKMLDVNSKAVELFNYSKEEFYSISPDFILGKQKRNGLSVQKVLKRECGKSINLSFETIGLKKEKETFDCEVSISSLIEKEEDLLVIAVKDISKQKMAERDLEDRLKEIKENNTKLKKYIESNSELTNFAYVASHDMRQPVRTIKSFSQLLNRHLEKKEAMDPTTSEYLNFIMSGSSNLEDLINDLLDHSKVSSSNDSKIKTTSLEDILLRVKLNLNQQIIETQTEVVYENLPTIGVEPTRMIQLFQNIISNAIKFKKTNHNCKIEIKGEELEDVWQISIADNGIGIPEDKKEEVFKIFSKLHGMSEYDGHGIGLATCKKIVEFHEGQIWLDSKLGIGTTFYFTIRKNLTTTSLLLESAFDEN